MTDGNRGNRSRNLNIALVDAFAHQPGQGNRAAVIVVREQLPSARVMADVARFLNAPVTVFVQAEVTGDGCHAMRWFAPSGELTSCGHGTLAAAFVLFGRRLTAEAVFETALGAIPARRRGDLIEITMPAQQLAQWPVDPAVSRWLGVPVRDAVRSSRHGLLVTDRAQEIAGLRPDLACLAQLPVTGLAITAPGDGRRYDIVSRWFVPRLRLEDQATGTAHCLLGPYWAKRSGLSTLRARQESPNGADIHVTVLDEMVLLAGGAVDVGRRELSVAEFSDHPADGRLS